MAAKETQIVHDCMKYASELGARVWKNTRGLFLTQNGAPVRAGLLCDGSSDLIGFRSVVITQTMVGKRIAQFVALEGKTDTGKTSKEQDIFLSVVRNAGGIAGVIRCVGDVKRLLGATDGSHNPELG